VPSASWHGCAPSRIVPPFLGDFALLVQHGDDRIGVWPGQIPSSAPCQFQNVPRKFNRGDLHSEAEAEVGNFIFARVFRGLNFSFDAAFAESARHQNPAESFQHFFRAVLFNFLGVHLHDFHAAIVADAAVDDRLIDRFVGVLQADVFADDADAHAMLRRDELADDFLPVRHVGAGVVRCSRRQTRSSMRSRWSISGTS
jgi:hypothetical protein